MRSRIRLVQLADSFAQSARSGTRLCGSLSSSVRISSSDRPIFCAKHRADHQEQHELREDDEPDPPDHGTRISPVPGIGAFRPDQAFLFIKPQRRRRDTAARGHVADGEDGVHDGSVAEFPLDFKCT